MKSLILSLMLAFVSVFSANAQVVDNGGLKDNWYVGGAVGTNVWSESRSWAPVLQADHGLKYQPLMVNLTVGKYITPYVGFEVDGTGIFNSGAESNFVDGTNVSGNIVLNLSNIVAGHKSHLFTVEAITGLGWYHTFLTCKDANDASYRVAIRANYNVSNKWSVYLMPEYVSCPTMHPFTMNPQCINVFAGVTYRLPSVRGGFPVKKLYNQAEVDELNAKVNALQEELAKKPKEIIIEKPVQQKYVVEAVEKAFATRIVPNTFTVNFDRDSSNVSNISDIVAKLKDMQGNIVITGFTSPEGSENYNKALGEARANAVKTALVNAGIDASRITVASDYVNQRTATIIVR